MMFRRFWDTVWQKNTAADASAALFQNYVHVSKFQGFAVHYDFLTGLYPLGN